MTVEEWRYYLYPLGLLSSLAFASRFLLQWIISEKKKQSVVTPAFWKISLTGNILLFIHSFIQLQIHVCLIQTCNAVISWRNLNLMQEPSKRWNLKSVLILMAAAAAAACMAFTAQGFFLMENGTEWFRIPITPWSEGPPQKAAIAWHLIGTAGLTLFSCRFWIQWWGAEKSKTSCLGPAFWWISLAGDLLCLAYFIRLGDLVQLAGPLFGLPPYIRNLMLARKSTKHVEIKSSL